MNRGTWWATVRGIAESGARLGRAQHRVRVEVASSAPPPASCQTPVLCAALPRGLRCIVPRSTHPGQTTPSQHLMLVVSQRPPTSPYRPSPQTPWPPYSHAHSLSSRKLPNTVPLHQPPPPARGYPKGKPKKKRETKANKRIPLTPQYTHIQKSRLVGRGSCPST